MSEQTTIENLEAILAASGESGLDALVGKFTELSYLRILEEAAVSGVKLANDLTKQSLDTLFMKMSLRNTYAALALEAQKQASLSATTNPSKKFIHDLNNQKLLADLTAIETDIVRFVTGDSVSKKRGQIYFL